MRNSPIPLSQQDYSLILLQLHKHQPTTETKAIFGNYNSTCWKTEQRMHFQEDTKSIILIRPHYKIKGQYVEHNHTEQFNWENINMYKKIV